MINDKFILHKLFSLISFFTVLTLSTQEVFSVAVPLCFSLLMLVCIKPIHLIKISRRELFFFIFVILSYILMFSVTIISTSDPFDDLQIRRVLFGIILFFLFVAIINNATTQQRNLFVSSIEFVLIIHVSIFVIQFLTYHLFSIKLDIVELFGFQSNSELGIGEIIFYRPSGLYLEPGTFGLQLFFLYVCVSLLKKVSWRTTISVALVLVLTYSIFSILFAVVIIAYRYSENNKNNFISWLVFLSLFIFGCLIYFQDYLISRFLDRSDGSLEVKLEVVYWFLSWDIIKYFLGNGLANNSHFLVRDSSLFFNFIFTGGVVGFINILAYLILFLRCGFNFIILFFGVFFSKGDYTYMTFWLMTALFFYNGDERFDKKNNR